MPPKSTNQRSAPPVNSSSESVPDIEKVIKDWIWQRVIEKIGQRQAIIGLVLLFLCGMIWKFYEPVDTLISKSETIISEHQPLPRANPNVFTVALVPLDNDQNGPNGKPEMESDIVDALRPVQGIAILKFNRPSISDDDVELWSSKRAPALLDIRGRCRSG